MLRLLVVHQQGGVVGAAPGNDSDFLCAQLAYSVGAGGMLGQQEAVSQGLLLQQAALALQMQGGSTLYGAEQPLDASTQALHAHLRQQHYGEGDGAHLPSHHYLLTVSIAFLSMSTIRQVPNGKAASGSLVLVQDMGTSLPAAAFRCGVRHSLSMSLWALRQ